MITPVSNYTLNNTIIGETITVGCVVQTCGRPNVVEFVNAQGMPLLSFDDSRDVYNWNPTVSSDLVGTYSCVARNPLGTASQTFMITGNA